LQELYDVKIIMPMILYSNFIIGVEMYHPLGVNFFNPMVQGTNALVHKAGQKSYSSISSTELQRESMAQKMPIEC
jgi:hypothetical protein